MDRSRSGSAIDISALDQSTNEIRESQVNKNKAEMAPLFLFLASSFNVELVYVILKGITSFSYIKDSGCNRDPSAVEKQRKKIANMDMKCENGNLTLNFKEIKIKDFEKWSAMKTDTDMEEVTKDIAMDHQEELRMTQR